MVNDYGRNIFEHALGQSLYVEDVVRALRDDFNSKVLNEPIYVGSQEIRITSGNTGNGGKRPWFMCPACSVRVGRLIWSKDAFVCRHCANYKYSSSRFKDMPEDDARIMHG